MLRKKLRKGKTLISVLAITTLLTGCAPTDISISATPSASPVATAIVSAKPEITLAEEYESKKATITVGDELDVKGIAGSVKDTDGNGLKYVEFKEDTELEEGTYTVDTSELDTSKAGKYTVSVVAKANGGNTAKVNITVTVEEKESSSKSSKDKTTASTTEKKNSSKSDSSSTSKSNSNTSSNKKNNTTSSSSSSATTSKSNSSTSDSSSSKKSSSSSTTSSSNSSSSSSNASSNSASQSTTSHTHTWVAQTTTVHHEATGHNEQVWVQDTAPYEETVGNGDSVWVQTSDAYYYCKGNQKTYYNIDDVAFDEACGRYDIHPAEGYWTQETYTTIHHDATGHYETKWVQDSAAYDEQVTTGYKCYCGATK